jgi:uncharacterized membrane protein AbrB (regulator of aidB expression)
MILEDKWGVGLYLVVGALSGWIGTRLRIPASAMTGDLAGVIMCNFLLPDR